MVPEGGGIQYNLPTEHAANSIQTTRAILTLSALTGNVDNVGGNGQDGNYNNYFMYRIPFGQPSLANEELARLPVWRSSRCFRGQRSAKVLRISTIQRLRPT